MNKLRILLLMSMLLIPAALTAQEVFEASEGTYSTRKLTKTLEIGTNNRLLIRAAANLPGKITLTTSKTKEVGIDYFKKAKAADKEQAVDFIDLIAGFLLIVAGIVTTTGNVNLGTVLAGLGLLIEAIKITMKQGF